MRLSRISGVLGVAASVALPPAGARAGNDDEVLIGNEAAMTGGAVTATASDGAAAWYDPAGVAAVDRDTVDVSGSVFSLRHYRMPGLLSAATGERVTGDATEIVSIPSALSIVRRLSDDLRLGLGVFVSQTTDLELRETLHTDTPAVSTWILDLADARQSYHAGATLGWRVNERLRIGVTLFGIYRTEDGRGELFGGAQGSDGATAVFGTVVDFSVWTLGVELAAGVQWEPVDGLALGLAVRSPALDFFTSQTVSSVSTSASAGGMGAPTVDLEPDEVSRQALRLSSLRPPRVRAGVALRLPNGWISLDADFQPAWSEDRYDVHRDFVWNARLGALFRVADGLGLGGGLFTDRSSEPPPFDFAESQVDFYGVAAGLQIDNEHGLAPDEEAPSIVFSSTVAVRYAYGTGRTVGLGIDFDSAEVFDTPLVDTTVHEVGLHIGSALHF